MSLVKIWIYFSAMKWMSDVLQHANFMTPTVQPPMGEDPHPSLETKAVCGSYYMAGNLG